VADTFNHFPNIADNLPDVLSKVVRKVAFDIQSDAQSLAPVDTGFLMNSIYVKTSKDSSYSQVGQPSKEGASLLPEVENPPDDQTAYVAVGANYGIYVEMGTVHMPAQPYLSPAVEAGQASLETAASAIEGMLEDAIGS
jgi:HK97 gp10 family phage protein